MANQDADRLLRSWKEISAHLGVDERTCARWEQRFGMPIHRAAEGAAKSRVFAYRDELDAWFQETFPAGGTPLSSSNGEGSRPKHSTAFKIAVIALFVVVIAAVFFAIQGMIPGQRPAGQPADFHIRGSKLVIVDEFGKELWARNTGVEGLDTEGRYRDFFQIGKRDADGNNLPWLAIRDLDGDGRNEVLFAVKRKSDSLGEGLVICYDARGKVRWRFKGGRALLYGGKPHSWDYRLRGFAFRDIDGDGRQEIFVIAYHFPMEPCQLAALDMDGQVFGEFWNAGYLVDIAFVDLDGDGREEICTAGVNNEYGGGCLAVFDPANIHGQSPQGPRYSFSGIPKGSEKYYIDFPRTDVSLASPGAYVAGLLRIDVTSENILSIWDHVGLFYEIGPGPACRRADAGHGFKLKHAQFLAEGKIHGALDDAYYEKMRKSLRYWNGEKFVSEPTPVRKNVRLAK